MDGEFEEKDGQIRVEWAATHAVPGRMIQRDRDSERLYLECEGQRHFIKSLKQPDVGRDVWDVCWEQSWIDIAQFDRLLERELTEAPAPPHFAANESRRSRTHAATPERLVLQARRLQLPDTAMPSSPPVQSTEQQSHVPVGQSAATCHGLPIIEPESLRFRPRLRIHYKLQRLFRHALDDGHKLNAKEGTPRRIVDRWMHKRRSHTRPLAFSRSFVNRGRPSNGFDVKKAEAALVHPLGKEVCGPCSQCADGKGAFEGCVVLKGFGKGACTKCKASGRSKRCCFHKNSKSTS